MPYDGPIPFDQYGHPVGYYSGATKGPDADLDSRYVWEDNKPFRAVMQFQRFERGRSAAHAIYAKADDESWEAAMFLTDFEDIVNRGIAPRNLTGRFVFAKRGTNYGIQMLLIYA